MKVKNGIFIWVIGVVVLPITKSHAIVFPDQGVRDSSGFADENENADENADAISRFGSGASRGNQKSGVSRLLTPIANSSFENSGNRSPASVIEVSPSSEPKSAVVRKLKKEKAYQEVAVIANELGFFPSTVFVTEGVAVRLFITGASLKSQCFMLDAFGVRRQVRSQKVEEITFVPNQSGKFSFHCPMSGAKGTLVVRELDLGERAPASASVESADEDGRKQ